MALLAGVGSVFGPVLGAFALLLEELLAGNLLEFHAGILGLLVVLLVLFLRRPLPDPRRRPGQPAENLEARAMTALLELKGVTKGFVVWRPCQTSICR